MTYLEEARKAAKAQGVKLGKLGGTKIGYNKDRRLNYYEITMDGLRRGLFGAKTLGDAKAQAVEVFLKEAAK